MGQLGLQRSDPVLSSLALLWPVWLDEELFGVEAMPDGMCSLQGAEIGNLAVFNPTAKKCIFHPTNSTNSGCISKGAAIRSVVSIAMLLEKSHFGEVKTEMWGEFLGGP